MNTFYELLTFLGQHHIKIEGGGFSDGLIFDLRNKDIRSKKKFLMRNGRIIPQVLILGDSEIEISENMLLIDKVENPYEELELLYMKYKYSVPNEYTSYTYNNFIAKPVNNLTLHQLESGVSRQEARIKLEAFVTLTHFEWLNPNHHYWQSSKDKDLVLFREWT